jgi:hypothetical protein
MRVAWGDGWSEHIEFVPASDIFAAPTNAVQLIAMSSVTLRNGSQSMSKMGRLLGVTFEMRK